MVPSRSFLDMITSLDMITLTNNKTSKVRNTTNKIGNTNINKIRNNSINANRTTKYQQD